MPKHRRRPRATLYSPPPSQTRNVRVVAMRLSPGSSRNITSPRLTRSQRQALLGLIFSVAIAADRSGIQLAHADSLPRMPRILHDLRSKREKINGDRNKQTGTSCRTSSRGRCTQGSLGLIRRTARQSPDEAHVPRDFAADFDESRPNLFFLLHHTRDRTGNAHRRNRAAGSVKYGCADAGHARLVFFAVQSIAALPHRFELLLQPARLGRRKLPEQGFAFILRAVGHHGLSQ